MSMKIVVTKPGYNVLTETDKRNIVFTSDLASLKYYAEGSASVSGGSGTTTVEVAHNLGYIPVFAAYIGVLAIGGDVDDYCMVPFIFLSGANSFIGTVWADSSKLYLEIQHDLPSTPSVTFYYKIFRNSTGL